jgi:MarR family transcriptional regulator, organic hydroperoxide resistance regulator
MDQLTATRPRDNARATRRKTKAGAGGGSARLSNLHKDVEVGGRSPAHSAREVHRLYKIALQTLVAKKAVTVGNWYYLRVLWQRDGLSQQELSNLVGVSSTTAVPAIDNMERAGLISRVQDTADRRKFKIVLTKKGRALQKKLVPPADQLLRDSLRGVDDADLAAFFRVMAQIRANLLALLKAPLDIVD